MPSADHDKEAAGSGDQQAELEVEGQRSLPSLGDTSRRYDKSCRRSGASVFLVEANYVCDTQALVCSSR